MNNYYAHSRPEIQELVPKGAKKILDVGCAQGRLGKALKERQDCHVTGIECVPEVAKVAKSNIDLVFIGQVEDNISQLPKENFDCIILADVLEHMKEPWTILQELIKNLTPKGVFVISLPNVRHWSVLKNLLEGQWRYLEAGVLDKTHLRFFTRASIHEMLNQSGLEICQEVGMVDLACHLPGSLINLLKALGLKIDTLTQEVNIVQFLYVARKRK